MSSEATARHLLPLPAAAKGTASRQSPDWVRISAASALALRFRSGRFGRDFAFGGINLLLNYEDGCRSDCAYCGLARTRPGSYEDKSFIRVEWPLVRTDELVERMSRHEDRLTRLCISMVTSPSAFRDTCDITERIRARVGTPLSVLVAPPTLNRRRLEQLKVLGVDMIGLGVDAATEDLFRRLRTEVPAGGAGLRWSQYWEIAEKARDVFGPWKVNCHLLVGLGETDRELMAMFLRLRHRQIHAYLFSFTPEPGSRMARAPRPPLRRWRRLQLLRYLVEAEGIGWESCGFGPEGQLERLLTEPGVEEAVAGGRPFMTDGCPGEGGGPGCTRPYGSYRPSEPFRDFPFPPEGNELAAIWEELALEELLVPAGRS